MGKRILFCTLLILLVVSFVWGTPASGGQAKAVANLLIIIPPREGEVENKIEEESSSPQEKLIITQEDSDLVEAENEETLISYFTTDTDS